MKHVWYTTTFAVTSGNAESSSKLLSMSRQTRPEQCITTVFKNKSSQQKNPHSVFGSVMSSCQRQFNTTNIYFSEQYVGSVLLLKL